MESFPLLKKQPMRGFTLVEMMVVLSIIVLVTAVAVTGQSTFNRSLILTDTAYTIAFSLREAQSLGLSSRVAGTDIYNAGYGIQFSTQTPNAYILFADTYPAGGGDPQNGYCTGHDELYPSPDAHPGDCIYDLQATPAELVRTYALNRGYSIYRFCGHQNAPGNPLRCSGEDFETMHISFMRPSTDTRIFGRSPSSGLLTVLSDATIYLRSPDDANSTRCIIVSRVGQIGVTACP